MQESYPWSGNQLMSAKWICYISVLTIALNLLVGMNTKGEGGCDVARL